MIDFENLRTASLYINNQLLSRGLLRDGRSIDFADPGDDDYELADTMGRIMGVVNDLILRRDRDAEHRESLSTTLRTIRADSLRQTDTLQRLQDKLAEAQRKVALAEADENALRAQLKTAETTIHKLKDDNARVKRSVAETRAACANEVRKRDRQIEGLKKAASEAGRARGERKSAAVTTIHLTGEIGGDEANASTASTMAEDYDLRQETNGFLAQLAKGLSEENETLLSLLHKTNLSLKHMSGWDKTEEGGADASNGKSDGNAVVVISNPEDLAADIEGVLGHLRTMLTNPSFVPLEEVVVREEEIFRLRHGWEKMEERWREAVHLIDGWRQRMAANGQPVDMEDLKMGLRLSPVRVQHVEETSNNIVFALSTLQEEEEEEEEEREEEEAAQRVEEKAQSIFEKRPHLPSLPESLHLVPAPGYDTVEPEYEEPEDDLEDSDAESSIFHDDVDMEELEEAEPNVEILQHSTTDQDKVDILEISEISETEPLPQAPRITPLEETSSSGNRKSTSVSSRKRSGEYLDQDEDTNHGAKPPPPPPHKFEPEHSPQKRLKVSTDGEETKARPHSHVFTESNSSLDSILLKPSPESSVSTAPSRATARSTRSEATTSTTKEAPPPPSATKPATRRTRAVAAQEKKEATSRPLPRQRQTRATAATASSSARSAPGTATRPRAAAPAPTTTADMPPPPRPARSSASNSPAVQQSTPAASRTKKLPADSTKSLSVDTAEATPGTTTRSARAAKRVAESPKIQIQQAQCQSPGKSASRLPKPRNAGLLPPPQQSPLSMARIAAKLAASEREADAARVRAKLRAARLGKTSNLSSAAATVNATSDDTDGLAVPSPAPNGSRQSSRGGGDPAKRDRQVSSSSALTGRSGSISLDENGQTGGVSISRVDSSSYSRGGSSSRTAAGEGDGNKISSSSSSSSPIRRRRERTITAREETTNPEAETEVEAEAEAEAPTTETITAAAAAAPSSPRKVSPAKMKRERAVGPVSRRAEKVANRRRSTLNPWELQSLISGEVSVPPTPKVPEEHLYSRDE